MNQSAVNPRITILIPDGESFYLIAVLQCLSLRKGFRIILVSGNRYSGMRFSRFVWKFIHLPSEKGPEDWIDLINRCTEEYGVDVIMPMSETGIEKLLRYKDRIKATDTFLLPEGMELFEMARDKRRLALLLERQGIPAPAFWIIRDKGASTLKDHEIRFPALLKPAIQSGGGIGIKMFRTKYDLEQFLKENESEDELLVQEYIEGHDLGCNVLCKNGEILAYTVQVGNQFTQKSFTPQIGLDIVHNDEVFTMVSRLMRSLKWNGVANVDMRYDQKNNRYLILEMNTRYWLTLLASALAGVNFPWLYCDTVQGTSFKIPVYRETAFTNLRGLQIWLLKSPTRLLNWEYVWHHTPVRFLFSDPSMTVFHYAWVFKKWLTKKAGKGIQTKLS